MTLHRAVATYGPQAPAEPVGSIVVPTQDGKMALLGNTSKGDIRFSRPRALRWGRLVSLKRQSCSGITGAVLRRFAPYFAKPSSALACRISIRTALEIRLCNSGKMSASPPNSSRPGAESWARAGLDDLYQLWRSSVSASRVDHTRLGSTTTGGAIERQRNCGGGVQEIA